jgi:hypothetical protein
VPQTLSGGGSLQAGVHYTVSIQLTRRRLDFSLWARSTAFFDFVLGGVETVPAAFLPTVGPDGVYHFNVSEVGPGQVIFIDPQVAIGYDYAIGVGDPNFASVVLPEGIGDEQYGVYLFNARGRAYKVADVAGGVPFAFDAVGFPNGVDRFRVLGIEAAAGLDPRNVTAFVTGVSFVDGGPFTGTMTPLTRRVATSIGECQGVVATLRAQIEAAGFTGTNSERFRTRLIGELDQTAADLDNGQAGRAIRDLRQFKGQVTGLVASRRLNDADGNELLSGVADAIDCTSHLANSP